MKSSPHSLQLAKVSSKEDPVQSKEINLKKKKKVGKEKRDLKIKLLYRCRNLLGSFLSLGWKERWCSLPLYVYPVVTIAHQAPLSMGFSRQEYWSGLPFLSPGDLPDSGMEPVSPVSSALAGRFFTTEPPGRPTIPQLLLSRWPVSSTASYPIQAILISHLAVAFDVTEHFIF